MGYKHTEEQNRKMVETRRKNGSYFHTPETRKKISLSHIGKKKKPLTEEHRLKLSKAHKGKPSWNKGKKFSEETKKKMSEAKLGKKGSEKQREMMRNRCGEKHPRWIKDRTKKLERHQLKNSKEWKIWRGEVFERDNYTCQECGMSGVYIEPHHIIPIRSNRKEILFNIKNGITLCRPCHQKTIWKESYYERKYSAIVEA